jgi:hypothetical protein
MKLTTQDALGRLAEDTRAVASVPPLYAAVWLRAAYLRRERRRTRLRILQALVPAAVMGSVCLGLVVWNGPWLATDALPQLGALFNTGAKAFSGTALPALVVVLAAGAAVLGGPSGLRTRP